MRTLLPTTRPWWQQRRITGSPKMSSFAAVTLTKLFARNGLPPHEVKKELRPHMHLFRSTTKTQRAVWGGLEHGDTCRQRALTSVFCCSAALRVSSPPHGTPGHRDFLMDILLSPLSDSLLLLWDEASCVPEARARASARLLRASAARYTPGNMIGLFYTSLHGAFHYRLYSIT